LFQLYVYGATPPETLRSILPLFPANQLTPTFVLLAIIGEEGSVIVALKLAVQPLASVTNTE
jgi:hypothetical protein